MALPQLSYQDALNYITQGPQAGPVAERTFDLSGDTAQAPTSASPAPQAPATATTSLSPSAAPPRPLSFAAPSAAAPKVDGPYGSYFGGLAEALGGERQKTQEAKQTFTQAAGPSRTFESSGAQGTLRSAIAPSSGVGNEAERAKTQEAARGFVGAKYEGPRGLDQSSADTIEAAYRELAPQAQSLRRGVGAQELVRTKHPGLTTGQLRFEAQRMLADPTYRAAASSEARAVEDAYADFLGAQKTAEDYATQRAAEEEDIAKRSRAFLEGERGGITGGLAARVAEEKAKADATRQGFETFQNTGTLEDLGALKPELAAAFNTPTRQRAERAETAWERVLGQFQDLKDVPLMVPGVSSHGFARRQLPREWVKEHRKEYTKREWQKLQARAKERNQALEQAGFSPEFAAGKKVKNKEKLRAAQAGEFAGVKPLYFEEDEDLLDTERPTYESPDIRGYVTLEGGAPPGEEQLATPEDRATYNAIQDLLGESDRLEETEAPYVPPSVRDEAARYGEEEAKAEEGRKEQLAGSAKAYLKAAKKARKNFRKNSRNAFTRGLVRTWLDTFSPGGNEILPVRQSAYKIGSIQRRKVARTQPAATEKPKA